MTLYILLVLFVLGLIAHLIGEKNRKLAYYNKIQYYYDGNYKAPNRKSVAMTTNSSGKEA